MSFCLRDTVLGYRKQDISSTQIFTVNVCNYRLIQKIVYVCKIILTSIKHYPVTFWPVHSPGTTALASHLSHPVRQKGFSFVFVTAALRCGILNFTDTACFIIFGPSCIQSGPGLMSFQIIMYSSESSIFHSFTLISITCHF